MTPKAGKRSDELLSLRTLNEQRWAYDRRQEHLSYPAMRRLVGQAPPVGLGYDLSEHVLRSLVRGYHERMVDVHEVDIEEERHRALEDLDVELRRVDAVAELAAHALRRAAEVEAYDVHAGKAVLAATAQRRMIGESRRRLLGLDAPAVAKVDVVHHDAVTEELNAMLARAGRGPLKGEAVDHG